MFKNTLYSKNQTILYIPEINTIYILFNKLVAHMSLVDRRSYESYHITKSTTKVIDNDQFYHIIIKH